MKKNYYPVGKHTYLKDKKTILKLIKENYLGIVQCKIKKAYEKICLLPLRYEKKLYFPYGKWIGFYTSVELKTALKNGYEIEPIDSIFWLKKRKIFDEFVTDFYKLKENSTGSKKQIAKLILNSSYGKFAQKRQQKVILSSKEGFKKEEKIREYEILGDNLFFAKNKTSYSNRLINPIYSIFITAYSRLYMFELMKQIGFDHIYYTDTDSIIADVPIPDNLIDNKKLGLLKVEDYIKEAIFLSTKLYAYKTEDDIILKARGLIKSIKDKLNYNDFAKLKDGEFEYENSKMLTFMDKFRRLNYKNNNEFVFMINEKKKLKCNYERRNRVGNDYFPLKFVSI